MWMSQGPIPRKFIRFEETVPQLQATEETSNHLMLLEIKVEPDIRSDAFVSEGSFTVQYLSQQKRSAVLPQIGLSRVR